MFVEAGPHYMTFFFLIVLCIKTQLVLFHACVLIPALWTVCFEMFHFLCVVLFTELNVLTSMLYVLFDSVRLSGEEGWSMKAWIKAVLMMLLF